MARSQTTSQDLSNKLNALESAIVNAEESAEDARWQQAKIVVQMLDAGRTQKQIAADWYNGRTGLPYAQQHVSFVKQAWKRWGTSELVGRPDWTTAYYTVQKGSEEIVEPEQRKQEWSEAHEARAPKSEETAEKLVQNLMKAPPAVAETVYHGLRMARHDAYVEPVERKRRQKEAEAYSRDVTESITDPFTRANVVLHLEQALEDLQGLGSIDEASHDRILKLIDEIRTEAEVKRAMEGVR